MGVQNLQIIFDNSTAVFMPGQTITGRVLIAVSSSVKIRSVKLKLKGQANVSWTEQESRRNGNGETENCSVKYDAEEEYFENKITLVGGEESKLEIGEHVYPFNVSLPQQLPSTFNGEYGNVRYVAKVTIDIPWGKDKEKETMFEVISPLNLNDDPSLAEPKKTEKEKHFCCCCCKSGPLTLVTCVPYTGFVPGQIIPLTIELDNNSNVTIDAVKVKLEREIKFKANRPSEQTKLSTSELGVLRLQGAEAHASKTWTEQMVVPNSLMFSNLRFCGIIFDNYTLKIEAISSGVYDNTVIHMKITMGNIPLTIANIPHSGYPIQLLNQNNLSNEQFPPNSTPNIGFIEPTPIPGFPQQIPSYEQPSLNNLNTQQSINFTQSTLPFVQPSLYPQTPQVYDQSQISYPNVSIQQPSFNPSYSSNLNSDLKSGATAPPLI